MANPQKSAMDSYLSELTGLITERQKVNKRISKVEKVLRGMIDLLDTDEEQMEYLEKLDEITPPAGLTEAIQQVLQSGEGTAFLPTEIRDRVKSYLVNHSNEMASVHTTLKRLAKNNPFVESVETEGKTAYRWVGHGERIVRNLQMHGTLTAQKITGSPLETAMQLNATPTSGPRERMREALRPRRNKAFYGEK
jgi:hypothetical protein